MHSRLFLLEKHFETFQRSVPGWNAKLKMDRPGISLRRSSERVWNAAYACVSFSRGMTEILDGNSCLRSPVASSFVSAGNFETVSRRFSDNFQWNSLTSMVDVHGFWWKYSNDWGLESFANILCCTSGNILKFDWRCNETLTGTIIILKVWNECKSTYWNWKVFNVSMYFTKFLLTLNILYWYKYTFHRISTFSRIFQMIICAVYEFLTKYTFISKLISVL